MSEAFDPRLTFDTFVVGPANRLASAAARRSAESPGSGYNPLFLYSASGLGKSHILSAIAQQSRKANPDARVRYETLEGYLHDLTRSLEEGNEGGALDRYRGADILLLDDVQFLTGQAEAQEMLLRTLDTLTGRGGQVVLASDRPPAEIDGLDARLLSRFSGGLIVDIGQPDYETRVAIMRRKAEERGATLGPGVAEAMARHPFRNVRELQGALNRLLAVQELEERLVTEREVSEILGEPSPVRTRQDRAGTDRLDRETGSSEATGEPPWKAAFRQVIGAVESAGFSPHRIRRLLDAGQEPEDWRAVVQHFRSDVDRLREMRAELDRLGNPWPEAAATLLRDPDRLEEAENLLASARERGRPFPKIKDGPTLDEVASRFSPLAVRAARETLGRRKPEYNPLYLHAPEEGRLQLFLEAIARTFRRDQPRGRVALVSVPEFAEEFIRAISDGVAGAWRERWWTVDLLLLQKVEGLAFTERAQEEFFHLFEALKRRGGRIILAGDRAPGALEGVEDRLRTRFGGGLVVELGVVERKATPAAREAAAAPGAPSDSPVALPPPASGSDDVLAALRSFAGVPEKGEAPAGPTVGGETDPLLQNLPEPEGEEVLEWYPHRERVVWTWPRLEERIVEEDR